MPTTRYVGKGRVDSGPQERPGSCEEQTRSGGQVRGKRQIKEDRRSFKKIFLGFGTSDLKATGRHPVYFRGGDCFFPLASDGLGDRVRQDVWLRGEFD